LENRKKASTKSPKNLFKRKTKVKEGGALGLGVKREHDTRFLKDEEHLHLDGDIYEDWMETTRSPQHFQHLQHHLQQ
jgi:hypothetical protein